MLLHAGKHKLQHISALAANSMEINLSVHLGFYIDFCLRITGILVCNGLFSFFYQQLFDFRKSRVSRLCKGVSLILKIFVPLIVLSLTVLF